MIENVRLVLDMAEALLRVQDTIGFWQPVPLLSGILELPAWTAPSVALGALLSLVVLSGVAVGSLGVLIAALLLAYLVLDQVFGINLELAV